MKNDTIDVVCLVQSFVTQIPAPVQEARQSHASQEVVERTESNSSTVPEEPAEPPVERDQRRRGGAGSAVQEFLALLSEELLAAQVNTSRSAATQKSAQHKFASSSIFLVSIVVVLLVCVPAFLMLCYSDSSCSRGRERPVAKGSAAEPAADVKVGKKQSMRALLSSRSVSSRPASEPAGRPPGTGSWWRRLSKKPTDHGLAASSSLSMHSQRSSISVLRQGDPSQWAPQHALQSMKPGGPEHRFAVPMDSLAEIERKGMFQVRSERGDLNMTVAVDKDASAGPRLAVSAPGSGAARPMTFMVGFNSADPPELEIKDSAGSTYGLLGQTEEDSYVLSFNGAPVLIISGVDDNSLHMSVRTGNQQPVASVSCNFTTAGRESEEEIVELLLVTGEGQGQLVVTTVLAVLLLCADDCEGEDFGCRPRPKTLARSIRPSGPEGV